MKFSRRELGAMAALLPAAATAQTPNPSGSEQADLAKAARETNQRNSETLAKYEIPVATEPAFQFKA